MRLAKNILSLSAEAPDDPVPSTSSAGEATLSGHPEDEGFEPPFERVTGGSKKDNEAREDRRINSFFRKEEKVNFTNISCMKS